LIRSLNRAQMFTGVSKGYFPWGNYGMVLVDDDVLSIEIGYQLKRAIICDPTSGSGSNFNKGFKSLFSLGSYGTLLGDEDVWLVEHEYRLKRVITFDPTVGSRSYFYKGFKRLLSLR